MPLFTENLDQARVAYDALEERALGAERHTQVLQARIAELLGRRPPFDDTTVLRNRIAQLEAENIQLRRELDRLAQTTTEVPLQTLIQSIGLAAAIGEATMPDRAIVSLSATLQAYVAADAAGFRIRFQPPELGGQPAGLSATTFELAKTPPAAGVPAPRNLYVVLEDKQRVYTNPFWTRFQPAPQIIAEIAKVFSNTGGWTFPYLAQAAATIAGLEKSLAATVAPVAPRETVASYGGAVDALLALAAALGAKASPAAGDLLVLGTALNAATSAAKKFLQ